MLHIMTHFAGPLGMKGFSIDSQYRMIHGVGRPPKVKSLATATADSATKSAARS